MVSSTFKLRTLAVTVLAAVAGTVAGTACAPSEKNKIVPTISDAPVKVRGFTATYSCTGRLPDNTELVLTVHKRSATETSRVETFEDAETLLSVELLTNISEDSRFTTTRTMKHLGKITSSEVKPSEYGALASEYLQSGPVVSVSIFRTTGTLVLTLSPEETFHLDCVNRLAAQTLGTEVSH